MIYIGSNRIENYKIVSEIKSTVFKAQNLTRVRVKVVGADAIYATNKNRVFATREHIKTDFKPKGKLAKNIKVDSIKKSTSNGITTLKS